MPSLPRSLRNRKCTLQRNMKFHLQSCRVSPKSDTSCFIERSVSIMQLQQGTLMLQNSWAFGHCCMTVAWQTQDCCHPFATKILRDVFSAFSIIKCRSKKLLFSAASKCFSYHLGTILAKWSKEIYLRFFELPYFFWWPKYHLGDSVCHKKYN